ncbi:hypothetical protein E4U52_005224 [Claviceps spartinae]|nr:hypothetical protein E4U52_005224 [Claviceps spartinae]
MASRVGFEPSPVMICLTISSLAAGVSMKRFIDNPVPTQSIVAIVASEIIARQSFSMPTEDTPNVIWSQCMGTPCGKLTNRCDNSRKRLRDDADETDDAMNDSFDSIFRWADAMIGKFNCEMHTGMLVRKVHLSVILVDDILQNLRATSAPAWLCESTTVTPSAATGSNDNSRLSSSYGEVQSDDGKDIWLS